MIGKGITKGTKKQSTLVCGGKVATVQDVSHLKCAHGQVAICRTFGLGDSANSCLEQSLSVFYIWYELRWRHPPSAHLPQHFRKVGSSRTASEIFAGHLPCPSPKTTCTGHICVKKKELQSQFMKLDGPKLCLSMFQSILWFVNDVNVDVVNVV